ncbi:response regulator transcription factor [Paenibacillus sp. HB172176]|uniref:response regulator transcription factor n=1 Tax=Paenibacillus sp. HB172176 TaxID=2493690 RepID=UPI001439A158|nr:response regulator transcription factor [Paenibacillus sp. HB172176]
MNKPHVLIVDNEPEIAGLVKLHLRNAEMYTSEAYSGREAVAILEHYTIDLIVLDLMMENGNGWEVLRHLQSRQLDTPVIILSARHLEEDKIETLGLGADDYVTKPFSPGELTARIKALLRRYKPAMHGNRICCGGLIYDRAAQQLEKSTGAISLSPIEGTMLELFMREPGRIFTKQELFKYVWKLNQFDANSVNVYINFLRKKIEEDPANPRYIETIRGVGYRFVEETA